MKPATARSSASTSVAATPTRWFSLFERKGQSIQISVVLGRREIVGWALDFMPSPSPKQMMMRDELLKGRTN